MGAFVEIVDAGSLTAAADRLEKLQRDRGPDPGRAAV